MENIVLTTDQLNHLKLLADNLFCQGLPSTEFCRALHYDYEWITQKDLPTDMLICYNMSHDVNKPMRDLLNMLGYQYTKFGIIML